MKNKKSWQTNASNFTFIDLFAGIGGFRIAAEMNGGKCVFSSEWDKNSVKTYEINHGEKPYGDITKINEKEIPSHDILFGGFPCQAFSISGKRKGFEESRGTLFFDIARILKEKKPKAFVLENVKNLFRHDGGQTFEIIKNTLEELGYKVYFKVIRSSDFAVPQARERIYIVGFLNKSVDFKFPKPLENIKVVRDILEKYPMDAKIIDRQPEFLNREAKITDFRKPKQIGKFGKGGQGERIYSIDASGITLSAYGGGIAGKTGAYLVGNKIRKLSSREAARMQGFPEDFEIPVSTTLAHKQFGDSVSVPVLKEIISEVVKWI